MGVGALRVDLRDVELPPGRTELPLELGLGEIQVLVPEDMCVTSDSTVKVGAVDTGDGEQGGIDIEVEDRRSPAPGVPYLHIDADIGIGALRVGDRFFGWDRSQRWHDDAVRPGTSLAACEGPA
jgi:hypothetical protein